MTGRVVLTAQVFDVNHWGRRATQRLSNVRQQQNRQQASVETARADEDQIGFGNGLYRFASGANRRRQQQLLWRQCELSILTSP